MSIAFEKCFPQLMKEEGVEIAPNGTVIDSGYSNHPNDKGGETKFGITAGTFGSSVRDITLGQAHDFYLQEFWFANNLEQISAVSLPVAALVFDTAVNQGNDFAKRILQRTVGAQEDGIIGTATIEAIKKDISISLVRVIHAYGDERLARYCHIAIVDHSQEEWLAGWILRVISAKKFAFSLSVFNA